MGKPIFSRQRRPGLHKAPFTMFKFQTMRPGADPDKERITRLGSLLPFWEDAALVINDMQLCPSSSEASRAPDALLPWWVRRADRRKKNNSVAELGLRANAHRLPPPVLFTVLVFLPVLSPS